MNRHTRVDHAAAAATLRGVPGTWLPIGEYRNNLTARSIATVIRTASGPSGSPYQPSGSCEARLVPTEDGTVVEARYGGRRTMRQSTDTERVLGQIERGEVRAGRDAAREIAARAEAAYGAVWPADHARAEALAAVKGGGA
ncbi:hypothetical protein ACIRF8_12605 [Streptomyces sp. NPDC102406]|uniref:hypothetical protein n=1 Tax=Streptomyces sp. NPDC102406 TaxID=3366171 RepID=UPI003813319B